MYLAYKLNYIRTGFAVTTAHTHTFSSTSWSTLPNTPHSVRISWDSWRSCRGQAVLKKQPKWFWSGAGHRYPLFRTTAIGYELLKCRDCLSSQRPGQRQRRSVNTCSVLNKWLPYYCCFSPPTSPPHTFFFNTGVRKEGSKKSSVSIALLQNKLTWINGKIINRYYSDKRNKLDNPKQNRH